MRFAVYTQTEEVAGGRGATSSQARSASAALLLRLSDPQEPHPQPRSSATRTTGAPHEGLLFAPLTARSQKHKRLESTPRGNWRHA
jgi:hypothetical protein